MKKRIELTVIFCTIIFILGIPSFAKSKPGKIKVLIVDGFSNHDWKQTTIAVKAILEKSGLFDISVSTAPPDTNAKGWNKWNPKFKNYDVIIQNTNNIFNEKARWPRKVELQLEDYVKSGGGLYILHSANNAFANWEEYNLMIGLGWRNPDQGIALQIDTAGKIQEIPIGKGLATFHGLRHDEIIYKLTDHPINSGFPRAWKTPDIELYKFARGPAKNITVLSYAIDSVTTLKWPVEWTVAYGKGRVYNSSMGHLWAGDTFPVSYQCIGFQTILIRATEWLATGKVTYKVPEDFPTENEIKTQGVELLKK